MGRFRPADLEFVSTAYDWLVIAGARAQFKGSGTVNGSGDFEFLLTAVDGNIPGGGGSDKFRIKILDRLTDAVVYDNKLGESDDPEVTDPQIIGGGSINIHK